MPPVCPGSAVRRASASAALAEVVDCTDWAKLEPYLREYFQVHKSNKRVGLKIKVISSANGSAWLTLPVRRERSVLCLGRCDA